MAAAIPADMRDMTDRPPEIISFQLDLLRISGLAREMPHAEIKTITDLARGCQPTWNESAEAAQNSR